MSGLKKHVQKVSREVATIVARSIAQLRAQEILQSMSTMGEVKKVDGVDVIVKQADGRETKAINVGGRYLGKGDLVVGDGDKIVF